MIFGIFATLFAPTQFLTIIGIGLGIAGAIFGVIGLRAALRGAPGRGLAIVGLVLSVVTPGALVWWLLDVCEAGC